MNRRKFLVQSLIISSLLLLPNIKMAQVRPTLELELFFNRLSIALTRATIAGRNLGVAFEDATIAAKTLGNTLSKQEIKQSIEKIARPNDIANSQLLEMGIDYNKFTSP